MERLESALTSKHWSFIFLTRETCPAALVEALQKSLPHIQPATWSERLSWGGTFINGKPAYEDQELSPPCRVEYYEPKVDFEVAAASYPAFSTDHIIHEDQDLLAVFKPAKLPCLPVREQRIFNLRIYLDRYLEQCGLTCKVHMPSRLDTSVSGLVLVSKAVDFHNKLQVLYQTRRIKKLYILKTDRLPSWSELNVDAPITRDPAHPVLRKVADYGGKAANTIFKVLGQTQSGGALISAQPLTGRTHQIRLHAKHAGIPIIGDNFYSGAPAHCLNLHSFKAEFIHPKTRENLEIKVPDRLIPSWIDHDIMSKYTNSLN